jgi:hypothetical protein
MVQLFDVTRSLSEETGPFISTNREKKKNEREKKKRNKYVVLMTLHQLYDMEYCTDSVKMRSGMGSTA